jgi:hypothetical protein
MKHASGIRFFLPVLIILLTACVPAANNATPPVLNNPTETSVPTTPPTATLTPTPTLSFT